MNYNIPAYLMPVLESCPLAGGGIHKWLFTTALMLHRSGEFDHFEIKALLAIFSSRRGRIISEREMSDAVSASRRLVSDSDISAPVEPNRNMVPRQPKWPALAPAMRDDALASSPIKGLADLRTKSPVFCLNHTGDAEYYVDQIFPAGALICVGKSKMEFSTRTRETFCGDLSNSQLIVPSAMSALSGPRKSDGAQSAHTLANTGPRMYLVTEFDTGTSDQQAALIGYLQARGAPLVMMLTSGGKSLHAWWDCRGVDEEQVHAFMRLAVALGADRATWSRSQFVRLPEGWRPDKQARQSVFYFDPSILGKEVQ